MVPANRFELACGATVWAKRALTPMSQIIETHSILFRDNSWPNAVASYPKGLAYAHKIGRATIDILSHPGSQPLYHPTRRTLFILVIG